MTAVLPANSLRWAALVAPPPSFPFRKGSSPVMPILDQRNL